MENTINNNCATEIYLDGSVCYQTKESFEEIMSRLEILKENDFVYITLEDGCRAAFQKKNVVSVNQYKEK